MGTPFIYIAFTAPLLGQAFLNITTWRWSYGAFIIIIFFIFIPLVVVFKFYQHKAKKVGLFRKEPNGRNA